MKIFINFFLLFLFFNASFAQEVVFSGVDKSQNRTSFSVRVWHPTFDGDYPNLTEIIGRAEYQNDSAFTIALHLEKPVSATFSVPSLRGVQQEGWVTPQNHLAIVLDTTNAERPIRFEGKHAGHYNSYWDHQLGIKNLHACRHDGKIRHPSCRQCQNVACAISPTTRLKSKKSCRHRILMNREGEIF